MEFTDTLKKNHEFRRLYSKGKSAAAPTLAVYCRKTGRDSNRIGYTVSNKIGNAVTRNRIRRYLREDARQLRGQLKGGKYIFVARPSAKEVRHELLAREMRAVLSRAKLLNETEVR